jgi:hypothetical protein
MSGGGVAKKERKEKKRTSIFEQFFSLQAECCKKQESCLICNELLETLRFRRVFASVRALNDALQTLGNAQELQIFGSLHQTRGKRDRTRQ